MARLSRALAAGLGRLRQFRQRQHPEQAGERQRIGQIPQQRAEQRLAAGPRRTDVGGQRQDAGPEQQPDSAGVVTGFQSRHGQRAPGEEFTLGNEDDPGDGKDQDQRQCQQGVDGTVGDAILGQQGEDFSIHNGLQCDRSGRRSILGNDGAGAAAPAPSRQTAMPRSRAMVMAVSSIMSS